MYRSKYNQKYHWRFSALSPHSMFKKNMKEETQFLADMFAKNGHKRTFLETLVKDHNAKSKTNDNHKYTNLKKILLVPNIPNIGPKIRREFKKVNKGITFTSGMDLKSILCQNKPKLLPNSHPWVYQLDLSRNGIYIDGWKKKNALTRCIEHQQDSEKGNWKSSSATEHTKMCHGQSNPFHPRSIKLMPNMNKKKMSKAYQINRLKTLNEKDKTFKVLKRDNGDYVSINS